ncbi:helix-turn-helix domain-containing protein [Bradyrhizobium sp. CCBAU 65884]|uniref:helix-turn-helix domain-containing protein n=1 Tax=Bradyrhizobium sp. CCBAU 65884 TaxID=722477 RepID=UPI003FA40974
MGRRRVLTSAQVEELLARVKADEKKAALARQFGVSRETVHRHLRAAKTATSAVQSQQEEEIA